MRTTIHLAILSFLHCAALAQENTGYPKTLPQTPSEKAAFMLLVSDRDGDGEISRAEAPGRVYLDSFERFDTDGSGRLKIEEIRLAARNMTMSTSMIRSFERFFESHDNDKSGSLSQSEVASVDKLADEFDRWDLDQDQELSEYESAAYVRTQQVIKFQQNTLSQPKSADTVRAPRTYNLAQGWYGSSPNGHYRFGIDREIRKSGVGSAYIRAAHGTRDFASFAQTVLAEQLAGKRVRLSAYLKTADVKRGNGTSSIWFRADGSASERAFDNMGPRAVRGTNDWQPVTVVLNVPADAVTLVFGGLHRGSGTAWFDDFSLEVVEDKIPVSRENQEIDERIDAAQSTRERLLGIADKRYTSSPENLGFERPGRLLGVGIKDSAITAVTKDSVAENLGVQIGDRILNFNGKEIDTPILLRDALGTASGICELRISRAGEEIKFEFETSQTETKSKNASEWPAASPDHQKNAFARFSEFFFGRRDADQDGKLTKQEIPKGMQRYFEQLDADSSGDLNEKELSKLPELVRQNSIDAEIGVTRSSARPEK